MSIHDKTSYRQVKGMGRRALLRGAGTVAIGLPFLGILGGSRHVRAVGDMPPRLMTVFFANGWPPDLFTPAELGTSYTLPDVLTPLAPFRDKLTVVTGVDYKAGTELISPDGMHSKGNGMVFTGSLNTNFDDTNKDKANATEGPSIDVFLQKTLDPSGDRPLLTLGAFDEFKGPQIFNAKSFGGPDEVYRPTLDPAVAFDLIFGSVLPSGGDTEDPGGAPSREELKRRRYAVSVLDTVLGEYHRVTSPRFGLDPQSRAMISDHLDRLRDLERRILGFAASTGGPRPACEPGSSPTSMRAYGHGDYPAAFQLHAELFAMAMRCDAVRFGSLMFGSGQEAYALPGPSAHEHRTAHDEYNGAARDACGCEGAPRDFPIYKRHQMERFAGLLAALDDPSYPEPNGKTLLDNMIVVAGSELGPPAHFITDTTYLVAGTADGQIRPAHHHFEGRANNDLLSALVNYTGVPTDGFGDERVSGSPMDLG